MGTSSNHYEKAHNELSARLLSTTKDFAEEQCMQLPTAENMRQMTPAFSEMVDQLLWYGCNTFPEGYNDGEEHDGNDRGGGSDGGNKGPSQSFMARLARVPCPLDVVRSRVSAPMQLAATLALFAVGVALPSPVPSLARHVAYAQAVVADLMDDGVINGSVAYPGERDRMIATVVID